MCRSLSSVYLIYILVLDERLELREAGRVLGLGKTSFHHDLIVVASGVEGMGSEPRVGKDGQSSRAVTLGVPLNNKSNLDPLQRSIGPPQPHQSRWPLRGDAG